MRPSEEYRVFDRADWRRKVRVPDWQRRAETEKHPALEVQKTSGKW